MAVAVRNRQRSAKIIAPAVARCVDAAARAVARRHSGSGRMFPCEISVVFVNDRVMRELNLAWRSKDKTTDVLSFPLEEDVWACIDRPDGLPPVALGDIVISVPQAMRQADAYGVTLSEEIARLLVHGTLHLLGYDHERGTAEARAMRSLEAAILRKMEKEPLCSN